MKNCIKITSIEYGDEGHKIIYQYTYDKAIAKYFNIKESFFVTYKEDVSEIPLSIAIIPFLANLAPIAWFAGFDIEVEEVDADFFDALKKIKEVFSKAYPHLKKLKSELRYKHIIQNISTGKKKAMLFSGGVDAYATYFRHNEESNPLELITINGADIPLEDIDQWSSVVYLNETEILLKKNYKHYINTNLRDFYTYNTGLLLEDLSWWGRIQHGLALTGVTAPIAYINGFTNLFIGSTHTKNIEIPWGSSPYTDNLIQWGGMKVVHDAYELERLDKIELIISSLLKFNKKLILRVCYSELNKGVNCSKCEKCVRTMFAIILFNGNPNDYGFETDSHIYESILSILNKSFHTKGIYYHWIQLIKRANETDVFFVFKDIEIETIKMASIKNKNLTFNELTQKKSLVKKNRIKYILRNRFASIYKVYLNLRQR